MDVEKLEPETTAVVACSMLEAEVEEAMRRCGYSLPVLWIEKSLHEQPALLHDKLVQAISLSQEKKQILLACGLCGNAVLGLTSPKTRLIIPKFDDCIRMLLAVKQGCPIPSDPRNLYFTDAWMDSQAFIFTQAENYRQRYGINRGKRLMQAMLANYRGACLIDTGLYCIEKCRKQLEEPLKEFSLEYRQCQGTLRVLEKLFRPQWDEEFCVIKPRETVTLEHFQGRQPCG